MPDENTTMPDILERLKSRFTDPRIVQPNELSREAHDEIAELRISVIAFCGPWAEQYARDHGYPPGYIDATHYGILKRAGARMDAFKVWEGGYAELG